MNKVEVTVGMKVINEDSKSISYGREVEIAKISDGYAVVKGKNTSDSVPVELLRPVDP